MKQNIIIKLVILLVIAVLVYSAFWFFTVNQVEKRVNNFISENIANASSGEISVSGFPLTQKITIKNLKLTIPNPALNKNQIVIKTLEAKCGIFDSKFKITLPNGVSLQDMAGAVKKVEFKKTPKITIELSKGKISEFNYDDSGYIIKDKDNNILNSTGPSTIKISSKFGDDQKITTKISAKVANIEGFDLTNIYKNVFEKKIIKGLKTGELALSAPIENTKPQDEITDEMALDNADDYDNYNKILDENNLDAVADENFYDDPQQIDVPYVAANLNDPAPAQPQEDVIDNQTSNQEQPYNQDNLINNEQNLADTSSELPNDISDEFSDEVSDNQNPNIVNDNLESAISQNSDEKQLPITPSDFVLEAKYILSPINNDKQAQIPTDPTKVQEIPLQYSKLIKITTLEFTNPQFKIIINGEINSAIDDNKLFGSVSIKVENITDFTQYVINQIDNIAQSFAPPPLVIPNTPEITDNNIIDDYNPQQQPNDITQNQNANPDLANKNMVLNPVSPTEIAVNQPELEQPINDPQQQPNIANIAENTAKTLDNNVDQAPAPKNIAETTKQAPNPTQEPIDPSQIAAQVPELEIKQPTPDNIVKTDNINNNNLPPISENITNNEADNLAAAPAPSQDIDNEEYSYYNFLNRVADGFEPISQEIAAQNIVSKEEISEFEIRREKNLEFQINGTPLRAIVGKF